MKKCISALCLLIAVALVPFAAQAADWPTKPVTIVVSYAAGGTHDTMARILVPHMEKELGVKVIVKNSSGAAGTIGAAEAANAKPDGHTLYIFTGGPCIMQPAVRKLPYGPESFTLVSQVFNTPHALMVRKDSEFKTLDDFIKAANAKPGELLVSVIGVASTPHLNLLAFCKAYNIKIKVMSERTGAEAMKNLAGGTLHASLDNEAYVPRFDMRGLVRFSPTRSPEANLADIPSTKEFGKDVYWSAWTGVAGPKGMPDAVVKKLDTIFAKIMKEPQVQALAKQNGLYAEYIPTAEFRSFVKKETGKMGTQQYQPH